MSIAKDSIKWEDVETQLGCSMASILVVDDSVVDRQLIKGLLAKDTGFNVGTAENPSDALSQLSNSDFDLVVTDLQMPDRDGLDLVRSMRMEFPELPAILVTAHGSEKIAAQALVEGAAGYVPKNELGEKLVQTVRNTLLLMEAERSYVDLVEFTRSTRFEFQLSNDPQLIPALLDLTQQMMAAVGQRNSVEKLRCAVALEHAVFNAMFHGNLEFGERKAPSTFDSIDEETMRYIFEHGSREEIRDRKIDVEINIDRTGCRFVVEDGGCGFDTPDLEEIAEGEKMTKGGRGLILMNSFMDNIEFNEAGNKVAMTRHWDDSSRSESGERLIQQFDDTSHGTNISDPIFGMLVSEKSGRNIPLSESRLVIGRRKTCHVVLPHREVSAHHCQLYIVDGFWYAKDLGSENGIKINGRPVRRGRLDPGDTLTLAKYNYRIEYSPTNNNLANIESEES